MPLSPGHWVQVPLLIVAGPLLLWLAWRVRTRGDLPVPRALAIALFALGAEDLAHAYWHITEPSEPGRQLFGYFSIALAFALLYAALAIGRARRAAPLRSGAAWIGAGLLAAEGLYALRPTLYLGDPATAPLRLFTVSLTAIAGVLVAWRLAQPPAGELRGTPNLSLSLAFSAGPLVSAVFYPGNLVYGTSGPSVIDVGVAAGVLVALGALAGRVKALRASPAGSRVGSRGYRRALLVPIIGATLLFVVSAAASDYAAQEFSSALFGLWRIAVPLLVVRALRGRESTAPAPGVHPGPSPAAPR